jgi:hypothetical protein
MNADTFIKAKLADFCIEERWMQGDAVDMESIAFVIRNRVQAGWAGGDWVRVLEKSIDLRGNVPARVAGLDLQRQDIRDFLSAIDSIYDGSAEDGSTNGALYYCNLHNLTNLWLRDNIVRDHQNHPRVATVGTTAFFG